MKIEVDFRFIEIEYEIWALQEYFATTERQLPVLIEQERKRIREELKNADDETWDLVHQELYDLTENVLPRFFRAPIVVALWAIYESGTTEVANYLQKAGGHNLGLRDLKGKNTLDTARKYFDNILKFPLYTDESVKEQFEMLLILRNAIAHGNGRKDAVNENYWKKIQIWENEGKGISSVGDYLAFSSSFVEEMLKVVSNSLRDLIGRTRAFK
jgi:hypothetical protein